MQYSEIFCSISGNNICLQYSRCIRCHLSTQWKCKKAMILIVRILVWLQFMILIHVRPMFVSVYLLSPVTTEPIYFIIIGFFAYHRELTWLMFCIIAFISFFVEINEYASICLSLCPLCVFKLLLDQWTESIYIILAVNVCVCASVRGKFKGQFNPVFWLNIPLRIIFSFLSFNLLKIRLSVRHKRDICLYLGNRAT